MRERRLSRRRVLGVAFEEFDTSIVFEAHRLLLAEGADLDASGILVVDPWQVVRFEPHSQLIKMFANAEQQLFTLEPALERVSEMDRPGFNQLSLCAIMEEGRSQVSTRTLSHSDHQFSHYERRPTYPSLSESEKGVIFGEVFHLIEEVFDTFLPDLVWCVGNNYLGKVLAFSIAETRKIQFETFIPSRVGDWWLLDSEFGLGTSGRMKSQMSGLSDLEISNASRWRAELHNSLENKKDNQRDQRSLYSNQFLASAFQWLNISFFSAESAKRVLGTARLIVETVASPKNRKRQKHSGNKYGGSIRYRKALYFLMNLVRSLGFLLLPTKYLGVSLPSQPYFFLPLHNRPEASTLTLGFGTDDEEVIAFVLRRLPFGYVLAIKENPAMVGDRRRSFYKRLGSHPSVHLLDPRVPSPEIISGSVGVLGVSGTALLEAEILGKPAIALGRPEFEAALSASGFDQLESFFTDATQKRNNSRGEACDRYLGAVLKSGFQLPETPGASRETEISRRGQLFAAALRSIVQ